MMETGSLRALAQERGLLLGAAFNPGAFRRDPQYGRVLSREFNCLVAEGSMKFVLLQPRQGQYDFALADEMVDFAAANDMAVRGHTLVWHEALPDWLGAGKFSRKEALDLLREHISTVVRHFRGRVFAWDVVNEAVPGEGDGLLREDSVWMRMIGPDYIEHAFHWAHEADPDAVLIYNDNAIETNSDKFERCRRLVGRMQRSGVPIHGVGFQYHVQISNPPVQEWVSERIRSFNDMGLAVHVTELDVAVPAEATEADLARQGDLYRDVVQCALRAESCPAVLLWGFTDRYSWIPSATDGKFDHALILDRRYERKPAYEAIARALQEA